MRLIILSSSLLLNLQLGKLLVTQVVSCLVSHVTTFMFIKLINQILHRLKWLFLKNNVVIGYFYKHRSKDALDFKITMMKNNTRSLNIVVGWKTVNTVIHKKIESDISVNTFQ